LLSLFWSGPLHLLHPVLFLLVGVSNLAEGDHLQYAREVEDFVEERSWSALGLLAEAVLCQPVGLPGFLWRLAASCILSSSRGDGWPAGFSRTGDLRSFEMLLNARAVSVPLLSFLLLKLGAFPVETAKFATVSPGLRLGMGFRASPWPWGFPRVDFHLCVCHLE